MRFLNLGKKDEYGRQRRIEHRGRYLRASRTGGVALRAHTRAAGLSFTGNTARGVRVSVTPARNTQLALQNGRFILRGRYGKGPLRLNLSKTGLSLSARNALGSFNLTNPLRSSAKVAGVQVRGRTAAIMQGIYMVVALAFYLIQAAIAVALFAAQLLWVVGGWSLRALAAIPDLVHELRRRRQAARLSRRADEIENGRAARIDDWTSDRLIAALLLMVAAWGRGESARSVTPRLADALDGIEERRGLGCVTGVLHEIGQEVDTLRAQAGEGIEDDLALVIIVARRLRRRLPPETVADVLLEVDEQVLEDGPRTRLQDRMLESFADAAGLRLEADPEAVPEESTAGQAVPGQDGGDVVDINAASFEALQAIPHIGPERARTIMAMRPLDSLDELTALDGIGPKRLQRIREHGVVCERR